MEAARSFPWLLRAAWAALPFVAGPALATALDGRSVPVRTAASASLWGAWALVLVATLVLHPVALTVVRVTVPVAVVAAAWSTASGAGAAGWLGTANALAVSTIAFLPETGVAFVNGPAYPNERRFPLRVPAPLLLGPLPVAWATTASLPVAAILLLAARQWIGGGVAAVVAVPAVWLLGRALHGLSRRWVVFVPAGLVVHDPMSLVDPVLFPKLQIAGLGLAPEATHALDLTQRALGPALELELREDATLVLAKPGQRVGPTVKADRVLFTPTRPGRVLEEYRTRAGSR